MYILNKIFGDANVQAIKQLQSRVGAINALADEYQALNDADLKAKTGRFRQQLGVSRGPDGKLSNTLSIEAENKILAEILPQAFAAVREAASRTLGQCPYDVQLLGGMVLAEGQIAEMKTG